MKRGEIKGMFVLYFFPETRSSAYMAVRVTGDNMGILRESKGIHIFSALQRMWFGAILREGGSFLHAQSHIKHPLGIGSFIIIPSTHLHYLMASYTNHRCQSWIKNTRTGISTKITGNQRIRSITNNFWIFSRCILYEKVYFFS